MSDKFTDTQLLIGTLAAGATVGAAAFLKSRYHVALPNQCLLKMGLGVKNIQYGRTMVRLPLQRVHAIKMTPKNLQFSLHNMSSEKIEFKLPCSYTVGPYHHDEDAESFLNYVKKMYDTTESQMEEIIKGVIEGETRMLTANMSVEELFSSKEKFKDMVTNKVQEDLKPYGIRVYNANIQDLTDYDTKNLYFEFRKQRAVQNANNEAMIDVAKAKKLGQIGVKQNEAETRMRNSEQEAAAKLIENEQMQKIIESTTLLEMSKADNDRKQKIAQYTADISSEQHKVELMKTLAEKQKEQELETLKATVLTKTIIEAEQSIKEAEGKAKAIEIIANANLYKQQKEAEGLQYLMDSQSNGLNKIMLSCQSNPHLVMFYLGKDGLLKDVVNSQANAVAGMQPKVNIWNTGPDASIDTISKTIQNMVPLASGILNQTGLTEYINSAKPEPAVLK